MGAFSAKAHIQEFLWQCLKETTVKIVSGYILQKLGN